MGIKGLRGGPRGRGRAHGGRARPPPLWLLGGPPLVLSSPNIFFILKLNCMEFEDFWSCAEQVSNICSFSSPEFQLPAFSLFM